MFQRRQQKSVVIQGPSLADIEMAIGSIRAPGALCYANLRTSNRGLSGGFTFNMAQAQTPSGDLEVVLKEAVFEVRGAREPAAWDWDDDFLEAAKDTISSIEQTDGATRGRTEQNSFDLMAKLTGRGKIGGPLLSVEGGADIEDKRQSLTKDEQSRNRQTKYVEEFQHIKFDRPPGAFRIRLSARPFPDLSDLNVRLARLPLFVTPELTQNDFANLTIDMVLSVDVGSEPLRHSFAIRKATGDWRCLEREPNKRILAELLISRFFPEIHATQRLFPQEEIS